MRSVVFQDIFSNLLLAVLILCVISIRLIGQPDTVPPRPGLCRATETATGMDMLVAFRRLEEADERPGAAVMTRFADEIGTGVANLQDPSLVAVLRRGCVRSCYDCTGAMSAATAASGQTIEISNCTALDRCDWAGL